MFLFYVVAVKRRNGSPEIVPPPQITTGYSKTQDKVDWFIKSLTQHLPEKGTDFDLTSNLVWVSRRNSKRHSFLLPSDLPRIPENRIIKKDLLGSGSFGDVFEGVLLKNDTDDVGTDTRVAIKALQENPTEIQKKKFLEEPTLQK